MPHRRPQQAPQSVRHHKACHPWLFLPAPAAAALSPAASPSPVTGSEEDSTLNSPEQQHERCVSKNPQLPCWLRAMRTAKDRPIGGQRTVPCVSEDETPDKVGESHGMLALPCGVGNKIKANLVGNPLHDTCRRVEACLVRGGDNKRALLLSAIRTPIPERTINMAGVEVPSRPPPAAGYLLIALFQVVVAVLSALRALLVEALC